MSIYIPSYLIAIIGSSSWRETCRSAPGDIRSLRRIILKLVSMPDEVESVAGVINETHSLSLTGIAKDISDFLVCGTNNLTLKNPLPLLLNLVVQIEVKKAITLNAFIEKIPCDSDSLLDLASLSLQNISSNDMAVLHTKHSIKCPITLQTIGLPVRGKNCQHRQPFDAIAYLRLGSRNGYWKCPLCTADISPEDLVRL